MSIPDRELQAKMPVGEADRGHALAEAAVVILRQVVGRLRVICVSPTRALLRGDDPQPMTPTEVNKFLRIAPAAAERSADDDRAALDQRLHDGSARAGRPPADRTVILVEPNDAGGWTVTGPVETKALVDLFDPEGENEKRQRIRELHRPRTTSIC